VWHLCFECRTVLSCVSVNKRLRETFHCSFSYLDNIMLIFDLDINHCYVSVWHKVLNI
jgi:hypothetical protein